MKTKWFAPLLMIVLACGSSGLNRAEISKQATVDADGVQRIDVDMHSYYFEPNKIIVKAGTPVEIKLHNCSHVVPHNFTISSGDIVASDDKWGWGTGHVRFTPTKPGEYHFFCKKDSHEKKGMTGTLIVEE
ncbi:MAG TPA: cupredoxin domain-containing protein [Candidatus Krumholzibacteria bacterium]|jgi:plastocyanin|nr:cupredoxin domain-containing protein [Candidatus Krumholzibacteria bacterium]